MRKLIDLTYPLHEGMFQYPADEEIKAETHEADSASSGYLEFQMSNHHGTHIDAPAHKIAGGKKIDEYPLSKFINRAVVFDLTKTGLLERKEREINPGDIASFIKSLNDDYFEGYLASENDITGLLLYTGFSDELKQNEGLKGREKKDFEWRFPFISKETAEYIIELLPKLNILGIDSFSFDKFECDDSHNILLKKDILLLETIVNVNQLKEEIFSKFFTLFSIPLLYGNADAAQTRAYAQL